MQGKELGIFLESFIYLFQNKVKQQIFPNFLYGFRLGLPKEFLVKR